MWTLGDYIGLAVVLIIAAVIVSMFVVVLVPGGQDWFTSMMISSNGFYPDYIPTNTLSFGDRGFLFKG